MSNGRDDDRQGGFRPITPGGSGRNFEDRSVETRIIPAPQHDAGGSAQASGEVDDGRTIVQSYRRAPSAATPVEPGGPSGTEVDPAGADLGAVDKVALYGPVVGWLVVLDGPGRGHAVAFYQGMNSVGRAPDQRIALNYGDHKISRDGHFFVTFDPKNRSYHINHGGKGNLLYLNQQAVLGPMTLQGGEIIEVGDTRLRVVPLCGPDFAWDDDR